MVQLRQGSANDAGNLSKLIFSTAPILLPFLFGTRSNALKYLAQAGEREDGQYSAYRHTIAVDNTQVVGCITFWTNSLPSSFYRQTELSLVELLTPKQMAHVISVNRQIVQVFSAPTDDQLCIGHFAVAEDYRGKGIGKKLLAYAIHKAKQKNKKQIVLDVDINNDNAVNFYIGAGFTLVDETEFKPTSQTFYRMQYSVNHLDV